MDDKNTILQGQPALFGTPVLGLVYWVVEAHWQMTSAVGATLAGNHCKGMEFTLVIGLRSWARCHRT